jgi:hypothetical protein
MDARVNDEESKEIVDEYDSIAGDIIWRLGGKPPKGMAKQAKLSESRGVSLRSTAELQLW